MFHFLVSRFARLLLAALMLSGMLLAIPQAAHAAVPSFDVVTVKADDAVTIRTNDFPSSTNFTVRMDVAGNMAIDGIVVSEFNSGLGGAFESTFRIPAELKGKKTIAIRFDSDKGYNTYSWFNNKTSTITSSGSQVPVTASFSSITITGVTKNKTATVEARNLPANTDFKVRVGPFYTFARKGEVTQTFNSGKGGTVVFNITLPEVVKDVNLVAVRIDGGGRFAYNAFTNVDTGKISTDTTAVPSGYQCAIVSTSPTNSMGKKADLDAVWEVKNTGSKDWDSSSIDYGFVSGTKMYTYKSLYDMPKTVKSGETIKIVVDMAAPDQFGYFTTNWGLLQGGSTICSLPLNIRVR